MRAVISETPSPGCEVRHNEAQAAPRPAGVRGRQAQHQAHQAVAGLGDQVGPLRRRRIAPPEEVQVGPRSVGEALAGRAGKDALVAFANAYRDYAKQHPGRYAAMRVELRPEVAEASAARRHSEMTRAILRGYHLPEPDQTDAVRLLHSTFHGYTALEAAGGFGHHPRDTGTSWSRTLDALHVLLSHWPAAH